MRAIGSTLEGVNRAFLACGRHLEYDAATKAPTTGQIATVIASTVQVSIVVECQIAHRRPSINAPLKDVKYAFRTIGRKHVNRPISAIAVANTSIYRRPIEVATTVSHCFAKWQGAVAPARKRMQYYFLASGVDFVNRAASQLLSAKAFGATAAFRSSTK